MLTRKRAARLLRRRSPADVPEPFRPEWADSVPGLPGMMRPAEALALFDKWQKENDPEEDAAVLRALQEEFAEARRLT